MTKPSPTARNVSVPPFFTTTNQTSVKVLTDMALEWEAIDEGAAEAAVKRAQEAIASKHELGGEEAAAVQAALAKSLAQLHVKRRRRSI